MEAKTKEIRAKNMSHKKVTNKRHKFTKSEREYVETMVHHLSFQRLTDNEIVQWLYEEKNISIDRSTVSKIRNRVEKAAEEWYIQLRGTRYKYIAMYKQAIDLLYSYQKRLHKIIDDTKKPDVKVRAIHELHMIEMSIFSLWKQLPDLAIETKEQKEEQRQRQEDQDLRKIVDIEDINGLELLPAEVEGTWHTYLQCDGCKRWWSRQDLLDYHKRKSANKCAIPNIE
jgi:hypothetical protein